MAANRDLSFDCFSPARLGEKVLTRHQGLFLMQQECVSGGRYLPFLASADVKLWVPALWLFGSHQLLLCLSFGGKPD